MSIDSKDATVFVTGASGFIAGHTIIRLLNDGYQVKGSLRKLTRGATIKKNLAAFTSNVDRLSFSALDLTSDDGWESAMVGCQYLIHMASPLPRKPPKNENDLITPAKEGTLRALSAAKKAGVQRTIMTSSVAAVVYGHARDGSKVYDENDWSILSRNVGAYEKSKTVAEKAAWEFVHQNPGMEFVALNPSLVLGPILEQDYGTSGELVRKLMAKEMPGVPDVGWGVVDVRDVADAHVKALTSKEAAGERIILNLQHAGMADIAEILSENFSPMGYKIPRMKIPDWLLKLVAIFDKTAALAVQELGLRQDLSTAKAEEILGWKPRSLEMMVIDMAKSMIHHKVV